MLFDGPYGVYHSAYDSHEWMKRQGDPGFAYHAAMARLWGVMALRLANADAMPFDFSVYGRDLVAYMDDLEAVARTRAVPLDLAAPRAQAARLVALARIAPGTADPVTAESLRLAERDLLAADGIPDRPWFRHLVYAPLPSYAAETLPGVREAVMAGDAARAAQQAALLADGIRRTADRLHAPRP
jgi:N-acetylated-alpha-linked acidic dipeptidase